MTALRPKRTHIHTESFSTSYMQQRRVFLVLFSAFFFLISFSLPACLPLQLLEYLCNSRGVNILPFQACNNNNIGNAYKHNYTISPCKWKEANFLASAWIYYFWLSFLLYSPTFFMLTRHLSPLARSPTLSLSLSLSLVLTSSHCALLL